MVQVINTIVISIIAVEGEARLLELIGGWFVSSTPAIFIMKDKMYAFHQLHHFFLSCSASAGA
jgi:hypothetical protein